MTMAAMEAVAMAPMEVINAVDVCDVGNGHGNAIGGNGPGDAIGGNGQATMYGRGHRCNRRQWPCHDGRPGPSPAKE